MYKYEPIQTKYTLCTGIDDLYPYEIELPSPPKEKDIINYGLPPEEQVFQRVHIPKEVRQLNNLPREEAFKIAEANPEISQFIEKMWFKFTYGEWQYINGKALYISPTYWFYLNFWKMDVGLPKFRYDTTHYCTDLWQFMWWDILVQPSPVCYGEIEATLRKSGKTYRAMSKAYKRIIGKREAMCCIQSKTDEDARDAFNIKMVRPVLNLPFFFVPHQANSTIPKGEGYRFEPRSIKGDKGKDKINPDDFLFSSIEYRSSGETAADGPKWYVHVTDEDGKAGKINVWERHRVVIPALTQEEEIYGKELTTTTVEEMDKGGGALFCYKWRMSDRNPNKKAEERTVDERGKTTSGLWQWFCPSRCAVVWDKFGCAIPETPTKEQQAWLRDVRKDSQWNIGGRERIKRKMDALKSQRDKFSEMRKFPEEIRDMFLSVSGFCHFDLGILNERLTYFAMGYPPEMADKMAFGNLHWKGGIFGGEVEFKATSQEQAKFWISYLPRPEHANKWKIDFDGKKIPANWHKFSAGADAFKFDTEDVINKSRMSKGALTIYAEYDITIDRPDMNPMDYVTDDICVEYLWREDSMTVDDLCEDYLKACIFYGCKLFPEKNNPEVVSYFKRHGFDRYLEFDREYKATSDGVFLQAKGGAGANTDSKSIQSMFKVVQRYVKEKGMRCKFYRTLEQLKHVSPDDMNPYDLFVSLATCLRVVQEFNPIRLKEDDTAEDISDLMGSFSPSVPFGNESGGESYGDDY